VYDVVVFADVLYRALKRYLCGETQCWRLHETADEGRGGREKEIKRQSRIDREIDGEFRRKGETKPECDSVVQLTKAQRRLH